KFCTRRAFFSYEENIWCVRATHPAHDACRGLWWQWRHWWHVEQHSQHDRFNFFTSHDYDQEGPEHYAQQPDGRHAYHQQWHLERQYTGAEDRDRRASHEQRDVQLRQR